MCCEMLCLELVDASFVQVDFLTFSAIRGPFLQRSFFQERETQKPISRRAEMSTGGTKVIINIKTNGQRNTSRA